MTDWKNLASALEPTIPASDIEKIVPLMESLEAAFRPLQQALPPDADVWTA